MVDGVKDIIIRHFKTNTAKDYNKRTCVKNVYGSGKKSRKLKVKKQSEDIRKLLEQEEDYCKPVRVGNFCNINYTKYESNRNE